jgi:hypothetical protein
MDFRINLQSFYDVVSYRTGIDINATAVIESVLSHLSIGRVILTAEDRDVAYLSLTENGDWKIIFIN